ncbi:MAG: hypothetical protein WBJ68_02605 [Candidatus Dechloromonas phosphoritropha]
MSKPTGPALFCIPDAIGLQDARIEIKRLMTSRVMCATFLASMSLPESNRFVIVDS